VYPNTQINASNIGLRRNQILFSSPEEDCLNESTRDYYIEPRSLIHRRVKIAGDPGIL
jgi:hypothetical protein